MGSIVRRGGETVKDYFEKSSITAGAVAPAILRAAHARVKAVFDTRHWSLITPVALLAVGLGLFTAAQAGTVKLVRTTLDPALREELGLWFFLLAILGLTAWMMYALWRSRETVAREDSPTPAAPASPAGGPEPPAPPMVLVVEDNPQQREEYAKVLEAKGYRVVTQPDGQAALDYVRTTSEPPTVILTDYDLPNMKGVWLARSIREAGVTAPIVLHTKNDYLMDQPITVAPGEEILGRSKYLGAGLKEVERIIAGLQRSAGEPNAASNGSTPRGQARRGRHPHRPWWHLRPRRADGELDGAAGSSPARPRQGEGAATPPGSGRAWTVEEARRFYEGVVALNAGGTMDMKGREERHAGDGMRRAMEGIADRFVDVVKVFERSPDSSNLGADEWEQILAALRQVLERKAQARALLASQGVAVGRGGGLVLSVGTDAVSELGLVLSLEFAGQLSAPIVLTGAEVPPNVEIPATIAEAQNYLRRAYLVAQDPTFPPLVYAVFGQHIYLASRLKKIRTKPALPRHPKMWPQRPVMFAGPAVGAIAWKEDPWQEEPLLFDVFKEEAADFLTRPPPASRAVREFGYVELLPMGRRTPPQVFADARDRLLAQAALHGERRRVGLVIEGPLLRNPALREIAQILQQLIAHGVPVCAEFSPKPNALQDLGLIRRTHRLRYADARTKLSWLLRQDVAGGRPLAALMQQDLALELLREPEVDPRVQQRFSKQNDYRTGTEVIRAFQGMAPEVIRDAVRRLGQFQRLVSGAPAHLLVIGFGDGNLPVGNFSLHAAVLEYLQRRAPGLWEDWQREPAPRDLNLKSWELELTYRLQRLPDEAYHAIVRQYQLHDVAALVRFVWDEALLGRGEPSFPQQVTAIQAYLGTYYPLLANVFTQLQPVDEREARSLFYQRLMTLSEQDAAELWREHPKVLARRLIKDALMAQSPLLREIGLATDQGMQVKIATNVVWGRTNTLLYEPGNMLLACGVDSDLTPGWPTLLVPAKQEPAVEPLRSGGGSGGPFVRALPRHLRLPADAAVLAGLVGGGFAAGLRRRADGPGRGRDSEDFVDELQFVLMERADALGEQWAHIDPPFGDLVSHALPGPFYEMIADQGFDLTNLQFIGIPGHSKQPLLARMDEFSWLRVLGNLFANALHAMAESPVRELTIETGTGDHEDFVRITDTGHGIAPVDLDLIWSTSFTKKPAGIRGTGQGLPIVKDMVTEHGGTITVNSTLGKGTTFTIRFPVPDSSLPGGATGLTGIPDPTRRHRVGRALGHDGVGTLEGDLGPAGGAGQPRLGYQPQDEDPLWRNGPVRHRSGGQDPAEGAGQAAGSTPGPAGAASRDNPRRSVTANDAAGNPARPAAGVIRAAYGSASRHALGTRLHHLVMTLTQAAKRYGSQVEVEPLRAARATLFQQMRSGSPEALRSAVDQLIAVINQLQPLLPTVPTGDDSKLSAYFTRHADADADFIKHVARVWLELITDAERIVTVREALEPLHGALFFTDQWRNFVATPHEHPFRILPPEVEPRAAAVTSLPREVVLMTGLGLMVPLLQRTKLAYGATLRLSIHVDAQDRLVFAAEASSRGPLSHSVLSNEPEVLEAVRQLIAPYGGQLEATLEHEPEDTSMFEPAWTEASTPHTSRLVVTLPLPASSLGDAEAPPQAAGSTPGPVGTQSGVEDGESGEDGEPNSGQQPEKLSRPQDAHPAEGVEGQEIVVAGDQAVGPAGKGGVEQGVVLGVPADRNVVAGRDEGGRLADTGEEIVAVKRIEGAGPSGPADDARQFIDEGRGGDQLKLTREEGGEERTGTAPVQEGADEDVSVDDRVQHRRPGAPDPRLSSARGAAPDSAGALHQSGPAVVGSAPARSPAQIFAPAESSSPRADAPIALRPAASIGWSSASGPPAAKDTSGDASRQAPTPAAPVAAASSEADRSGQAAGRAPGPASAASETRAERNGGRWLPPMRHLLPLLRAALQGSLLVILAQSTGRWFYVFQPDRSRKLMEQLETIRAAQAVGPEA